MSFDETEAGNMKPKVQWKGTKLTTVFLLVITFILTFVTYNDTYHLTGDQGELAEAISDYIPNHKVKAEVNLVQAEDDWMYVIFSDRQYGDCFMGMVLLKRGWNGRYVIRSTEYGSGPPIRLVVKPDNKNQVIIYGSIKDGRAVRYEYAKSIQDIYHEVMYKGNIDQETFFHVQENKEYWWTGFRLFDAQGKDITDSYLGKQLIGAPGGSTATAELFMVNVKCLMILFIGIGLAVVINKKRKDWGGYNENSTGRR